MSFLIDFVLHIDHHLVTLVNVFGNWTYLILFAVIFIETGAVIMPFLPGDSLLFAAAALAAASTNDLNIWIFVILFFLASALGDSLDFFLGRKVGMAITDNKYLSRFIKPKDFEKAHHFFDKYGSWAILLGRFMPIVRTFVPFVAASSDYSYQKFVKYNVSACVAWVVLCCGGGYFFGNIPFVKDHFSAVILTIILITLLPAIIGVIKTRFISKKDEA
ncbi:VTT domain-containing protein [Fructilactobacillus fructivorans]|uniref:DedA protein n=1 Tax=Fructilactobacillus fructivorans TaxID=1614 RepID=A0A0C1Q3A5_9LACO|nr:VTT domain-containing protein [Fructilactobacillus fructivorans]KID42333.1 DedA protein [Fructilactobacillus fructivorans]MCT0151048.1 cytochrome O ubiquinol oxidase [Fructilactobacillus fructivorans]MCT2867394.1 cytochrome O ubiquinol oxidase [Fructilactobacillus fructivorans]MCT2869087.1 cytochrome O ubiquinol oxidase [Fructilactobacillus fructivorans]MCT2873193.1 cytochrome O ubiquinol oxidase [Fructilactobacillus fructivorans]